MYKEWLINLEFSLRNKKELKPDALEQLAKVARVVYRSLYFTCSYHSPVLRIHSHHSNSTEQNITTKYTSYTECSKEKSNVLQFLSSDSPDGRLLHFPVGSAITSSGSNLFFITALN